eukprot:TRINITY_DN5357_c0_g2_i2.p2 TRINITY_DN5357_c0_g2~~TRINITY_DN5357_c0_g2_i2.p2  ORF type:complete len:187 (+),score=6.74 TRINITY_DN5357_c0_g2_i2:1268-1828(+)
MDVRSLGYTRVGYCGDAAGAAVVTQWLLREFPKHTIPFHSTVKGILVSDRFLYRVWLESEDMRMRFRELDPEIPEPPCADEVSALADDCRYVLGAEFIEAKCDFQPLWTRLLRVLQEGKTRIWWRQTVRTKYCLRCDTYFGNREEHDKTQRHQSAPEVDETEFGDDWLPPSGCSRQRRRRRKARAK